MTDMSMSELDKELLNPRDSNCAGFCLATLREAMFPAQRLLTDWSDRKGDFFNLAEASLDLHELVKCLPQKSPDRHLILRI
jgi:hypothetical protein